LWRRQKLGILDYFKPVDTWSPDKVRQFLDEKSPQEYNLVDVRTPKEYEEEHLPGARLIPVGELESRWKELDRNKPTITY
jgi:sulfur-carrier protein adenylyltransferase/sulfurtransferase